MISKEKTGKYFDLPLGVESYKNKDGSKTNRFSRFFANFAFCVVSVFCKICWRYKVCNKEILSRIGKEGGAIIIANHTSYLDAAFFYLAPRPKHFVRILARDNLFDGIGGRILALCGAVPISRNSADRSALKRAVKMIKNGEFVGIMPEGTRRGKGSGEIKIHSGFCLIAKMAGDAPIIPMSIEGADKIKQKGRFPKFNKVTLKLGEPIQLSDFDKFEKSQRMDICAWYAMREVFALRDGVNSGEVDMKALFPDDEDYRDLFE